MRETDIITSGHSTLTDIIRYNLSEYPPRLPPLTEEDACKIKSHDDDFRLRSGVFAIVAGLEHSGTTMAGSLLASAPNLYAGFECGLLAAEAPSEFSSVDPFFTWMAMPSTNHMWGLSPEHRDELLAANCHAQQYVQLRKYSPIYQIHNESWIIDKTPMYYRNLLSVMDRTPKVPVIVTWKEEKDIIRSFQKRNVPMQEINRRIDLFHTQLTLSQAKYKNRIYILNETEFANDPDIVMEQMFAFVGLKWNPSYKSMEAFNAKGIPIGRPKAPALNTTRSQCETCQSATPYAT